MNIVKVLVEGYAKVNPDGTWDATGTATLINTGKHKIIMDPGCHQQMLMAALAREKLQPAAIDCVFISHYHPDHCLLMGIFERATVFDSIQYQKGPLGGETGEYLPDTDIRIVKTPGHAPEHASLLVPTAKGKILVGADVFWWAEGEPQDIAVDKPDAFASDMAALKLSRAQALAVSDWIIPGHGRMFKVHHGTGR